MIKIDLIITMYNACPGMHGVWKNYDQIVWKIFFFKCINNITGNVAKV